MANKTGATSLGMQSENFGYSSVRLRRIKKLQFGIVNPNELVCDKYMLLLLLLLLTTELSMGAEGMDDDDDSCIRICSYRSLFV